LIHSIKITSIEINISKIKIYTHNNSILKYKLQITKFL